MRGVEEKGAVRGAVMGEELQAKQARPSARASCRIYAMSSEKSRKILSCWCDL